jgi:hypothetical protein
VSVTLRPNERRITRGEPPLVWKYFQYLALLFFAQLEDGLGARQVLSRLNLHGFDEEAAPAGPVSLTRNVRPAFRASLGAGGLPA